MKLKIFTALTSLVLSACLPGQPGYVSSSKSDFDGKYSVKAEGAICSGGEIDLFSSDPEQITLIVGINGATFTTNTPLEVRIDQTLTSFRAAGSSSIQYVRGVVGPSSYQGGHNLTQQSFLTDRKSIEAMLASKDLALRITTNNGATVLTCNGSFPGSFRTSAKSFLAKVNETFK